MPGWLVSWLAGIATPNSAPGTIGEERARLSCFLGHLFSRDLATYKRWLLHMVDALKVCHSHDIVHRDLHVEMLLFSPDGSRLVVCDLEGR